MRTREQRQPLNPCGPAQKVMLRTLAGLATAITSLVVVAGGPDLIFRSAFDPVDVPPTAALVLNDTGVTGCATAGDDRQPCNNAQAGTDQFPGQDAEFGRDAMFLNDGNGHAGFVFTKLDSAGQPLPNQSEPYVTSPWTCVRDEVTGLTWEAKTDDGGLRDRHWTYSWYSSSPIVGQGFPGVENGGECVNDLACDTEKFAVALNAAQHCGFNDWRLPTRLELLSLVDYQPKVAPVVPGGRTPYIDSDYFPHTEPGDGYWSISRQGVRPRVVSFRDGHSRGTSPTEGLSIRLVRGGRTL